jgi:hypothetical protein
MRSIRLKSPGPEKERTQRPGPRDGPTHSFTPQANAGHSRSFRAAENAGRQSPGSFRVTLDKEPEAACGSRDTHHARVQSRPRRRVPSKGQAGKARALLHAVIKDRGRVSGVAGGLRRQANAGLAPTFGLAQGAQRRGRTSLDNLRAHVDRPQ